MSINLFALAWQISFPGKPAKKLVLLSLTDSTNAAHDYTWPSYDTIAERCGISRRAVINAVNELEAEGVVTREARYKPGSRLRTSNAFRLNTSVLRRLANANAEAFYAAEDDQSVVNTLHHDSEHTSPHSEHTSLSVVNCVHPYGEHSSPKPEENQKGTRNEPEEGESAIAPPPPSAASFQPIPETVKSQKARRGIKGPEPDTPAAPPALKMLHELTAYWPGDDNAPLILASLGNDPDRSALTRAVELWRGSGHKINNWLGICDWYHEILRDPDWTPQARFKRAGGNSAANPTQSVSSPAPGSQPVTW